MKILLNGRVFETNNELLSYEDITKLTQQIEPTIVWDRRDDTGGELAPGELLVLTDGMIITAINTGQA